MTRVDFYGFATGAAGDPLHLACRLLEKAQGQGLRVYVNAPSEPVARALDRLIWTFRQDSFIPHGLFGAADGSLTQVLIGWDRDPTGESQVLLNLAPDVPLYFSRFERLAEVVGADPDARQRGRERYRFYRDRGYPLDYHEMQGP